MGGTRTVGHLYGPEDLDAKEADGDGRELGPSWAEDAGDASEVGVVSALFSDRDGRESASHAGSGTESWRCCLASLACAVVAAGQV